MLIKYARISGIIKRHRHCVEREHRQKRIPEGFGYGMIEREKIFVIDKSKTTVIRKIGIVLHEAEHKAHYKRYERKQKKYDEKRTDKQ